MWAWIITLVVIAVVLVLVNLVRARRGPKIPREAWLKFPIPPAVQMGQDALSFFEQATKKYGDIFKVSMTPLKSMVILMGNTHARWHVTTHEDQLSFDDAAIDLVGHIIGTHPFDIDKPWYDAYKSIITKGMLNANRFKAYNPWIESIVTPTLAEWAEKPKFDVFDSFTRLVLRVNTRCLLGKIVYDDLGAEIEDAWSIMIQYAFQPDLQFLPTWIPSPNQINFQRGKKKLYGALRKVFANLDYYYGDNEASNSYLGFIIRENNGRNHDIEVVLIPHIVGILFAAAVNTSTIFSWGFIKIAQNPAILAKIRSEYDTVMKQAENDEITASLLSQMNYIDSCLKETLRLAGPLTYLRKAKVDIPIGEYTIQKGSYVAITPPVLHRDPAVWKNPEEFDPSRFDTPEKVAAVKDNFQYLPFGYGRHHCLGERFASAELKMGWLRIFNRFNFELAHTKEEIDKLHPHYKAALAGLPPPPFPVYAKISPKSS